MREYVRSETNVRVVPLGTQTREKGGQPAMNLRKKVTTVFGAAAAASVIAGAAAFACTNLATLNLSSTA
ncbi:MAG TPA: hypothetical protein VHF91_03070, partial [Acidimicrobiales bacterium]|nr:hypothetical protein [Acidimicrobiales bacterium]